LQKVIHQLESWYGIQIELTRMDLKSFPITTRFTDDSLQDVLKVICFTTDSRYEFDHDHDKFIIK
jgi:hypothetical protein